MRLQIVEKVWRERQYNKIIGKIVFMLNTVHYNKKQKLDFIGNQRIFFISTVSKIMFHVMMAMLRMPCSCVNDNL